MSNERASNWPGSGESDLRRFGLFKWLPWTEPSGGATRNVSRKTGGLRCGALATRSADGCFSAKLINNQPYVDASSEAARPRGLGGTWRTGGRSRGGLFGAFAYMPSGPAADDGGKRDRAPRSASVPLRTRNINGDTFSRHPAYMGDDYEQQERMRRARDLGMWQGFRQRDTNNVHQPKFVYNDAHPREFDPSIHRDTSNRPRSQSVAMRRLSEGGRLVPAGPGRKIGHEPIAGTRGMHLEDEYERQMRERIQSECGMGDGFRRGIARRPHKPWIPTEVPHATRQNTLEFHNAERLNLATR